MRVFLYIFLLICFVAAPQAYAQAVARPLAGVVWQEPVAPPSGAADLRRMDEMGIEAVRTEPIRSPELLALGDSLGLQYFQELPVALLPARRLRDTLRFAERTLTQVLRTAAPHPSARTFGLARGSDTSDSTACVYFATLADLARRSTDGAVRVYYTTRFIEDDACGDTVDFVLLEALGSDDPVEMVNRWHSAHPEVPVGVAAVGKFVDDDAARGLNVEGSPEAQARFLERVLGPLMRSGRDGASAGVFVYRWRDVQTELPSPAFDLENPYRHAFGIISAEGEARPAADVVTGIFGRGQHVFAFAAGPGSPSGYPLTTLAGWLVLAILGVAYASSPRLRPMVPRYFTAHGFYREAVREGRDVLMTASIVLLTALALAVAIIWYVVFDAWRTNSEFLLLFRMLPAGVEEFIVTILGRPILFMLLAASLYGVSLTIWSALLSFGARRRYPLAPAQALMLAIWPRWAVIALMLGAMVIGTLPNDMGFAWPAYLLLAWLVITLIATVRTLHDYAAVTRVDAGRLATGAILNPLVLLILGLSILALRFAPEATFLWHAITRK